MNVIDPHLGLGEYTCTDHGITSCCDVLDQLRAKCSVVDGVVDCLYHVIPDVETNLTVVDGNIHVDCKRELDFEPFFMLYFFLAILVLNACLGSEETYRGHRDW